MTNEEIALKFLNKRVYDSVRFIKHIDSGDVFCGSFSDGKLHYTGLPCLILVKDGVAREATDNEMWQIMGVAK